MLIESKWVISLNINERGNKGFAFAFLCAISSQKYLVGQKIVTLLKSPRFADWAFLRALSAIHAMHPQLSAVFGVKTKTPAGRRRRLFKIAA